VLFEKRNPFVLVGKSLMFDEFAKEDIAPDGAQSESNRIKNQPEDDVFCRYFGPVFLYLNWICITYHKVSHMCITESILSLCFVRRQRE